MKIKFVQRPTGGRDYKVGDEVEFTGRIDEGYAQKYIARGWAEEVKAKPAPAPVVAEVSKEPEAPAKEKAEEPKKHFPHRK